MGAALSYLPELKRLEERISNEKKISYLFSGNNISELKRVTEKLEIKESQLQVLNQAFKDMLQYSSIGICEVGLDGKFLYVNDSWCKMCKRTEKELLNLTFQEITVEKYLKQDTDAVDRLIERKDKTYTMYKEYFDKDNNIIPIILTVSCVFKPDGEVEKFISQGICIDGVVKLVKELKGIT